MNSRGIARVAVGGILHETNTFSARKTEDEDFISSRALGFQEGTDILRNMKGKHLCVGGFIEEAERSGLDLVPLVWTFAQPSGKVRHSAYVRLRERFLSALKDSMPLDGVLLDLHGAMVTDRCEDAEGNLLERVRRIVGPTVPVFTTLDLHANVTRRMAAAADALIGYDTYPHVDYMERGMEAARLLAAAVRKKVRPVLAHRQIPLLIGPPRQCTLIPPMSEVFETVHEMENQRGMLAITLSGGFPFADIRDAGASVSVMTDGDRSLAERTAEELARHVWSRRSDFRVRLIPVRDAIAHALRTGRGPVVLADGSDNPGGGAPADGTVMLKELIEAGVPSAVVAIIADPQAVAAAMRAGPGATATIVVGGKSDRLHGKPLRLTGVVRRVGRTTYTNTGPMMTGMQVDMGYAAVFVVRNVEIILTEKRFQPFDAQAIRCMGIEPSQRLLVGLKSAVHFRSSYQEMAAAVFEVDTPGIHNPDVTRYRYRNLRRPIYPLDPIA